MSEELHELHEHAEHAREHPDLAQITLTMAVADQVTRNSSVGASLQQRFLGRFFLNVGFQHGTSNYLSSAPGVVAGRDDTFNSINLRLSTALLGRGTVAVTYQHSQNSSNTEGYRLTSSQYGVELAWRF